MIFTIEPMINAGVREAVIDEQDQWTARTVDGKAERAVGAHNPNNPQWT